MTVPSALEGFDVAAAVGRMLDEPVLWWQALALFVEHFADWAQAWQGCIGDDAGEQKKVHALRSAAANVGAVELSERAAALENCLLIRLAGKSVPVPDDLRQGLLDTFRRTWLSAANARKQGVVEARGATG